MEIKRVQATLREEKVLKVWNDSRKEFIRLTGLNPSDSDVLNFILSKI